MTETSQPCVIFAGTSASVREALECVAALRGIHVHAPGSVNDCRRILDRHGGALLVTELNSDAATALHSIAELTQRHPKVLVLAVIEHGDISTAVKAIRAGAANPSVSE
jgi:DNA-binding NtrC family response regulator